MKISYHFTVTYQDGFKRECCSRSEEDCRLAASWFVARHGHVVSIVNNGKESK